VDFTTQPIPLPRGNDPLFIVGNGNASTRSNAFEVSNDGHSIVYDNNGYITTPLHSDPAISGARYIDNTPIAWGRVSVVGGVATISDAFGVFNVTYMNLGIYRIHLDYTDPYTGTQVQINNDSSVVATIEVPNSAATGLEKCLYINTSKVSYNPAPAAQRNEFFVRVCHSIVGRDGLECEPIDNDFSFVVFGRP
jgi:hypothetical protein